MTRRVPQALPSTTGDGADFGRMLARLLGPAWQAPDASVNAAQFLAEGDAIAALADTLARSLSQCLASEATVSLGEWERALYLPVDTLAETSDRSATVLGRVRGTLSGSPVDLLSAIKTVLVTAELRERTTTDAVALGLPRIVFLMRIALGSSFADTELTERIRAVILAAKPAHSSVDFGVYLFDELITEVGEEFIEMSGETLTMEA